MSAYMVTKKLPSTQERPTREMPAIRVEELRERSRERPTIEMPAVRIAELLKS